MVAIVSPPEKPAGRGREIVESPIHKLGRSAGIPVIATENANDPAVIQQLRDLGPDVLVVASFGQLLKDELLNLAPHGALNVHASLLPRHRGASPISKAILDGDAVTGVAIQRMVRKLDAGPVAASEVLTIDASDTTGTLTVKLATSGASLLMQVLDSLEAGSAVFAPQDESQATYAKKLKKEDGAIDWYRPAGELERFIRAMDPWPGAFTTLHAATAAGPPPTVGVRVRILAAKAKDSVDEIKPPGNILSLPTTPDGRQPDTLRVATARGALTILRLQPDGGRALDPADFLRGRRLLAGSRFA